MKAQMVKNALIVPVGSKGGFVVKRQAAGRVRTTVRGCSARGSRAIGRSCGACSTSPTTTSAARWSPPSGWSATTTTIPIWWSPPTRARPRSRTSPTSVAAEYGFWLGDAFASGGSHGYDHKQMGITARGAWESVKRHFRELGTDVQSEDFTVVAIGDMSGDVFGNGMLCSPHIRLLAAFNHAHIFLDPEPDPETSFEERKRLFELPRSAWTDYDPSLISAGGGVHARDRQVDPITPEVRAALGISARAAVAERADLRAPQGARRPALQRRHRDLRQGRRGDQRRRPATGPTTRSASTACSCAAGSSPRAGTSG